MEKISYQEAVAELEKIVAQMEAPELRIENVKGLITRANELISFCRGELAGYEEEFSSLLDN